MVTELIDIELLCCLAYGKTKFKYAYEQGCKSAYFFLYMIGRLYRLKNDDATTKIVESIRTRFYELLDNENEINNNLMQRAFNYLRTFWKQIFTYRNDGEYSINNTIAERAIKPISCSVMEACPSGAFKRISNSAVSNTFIETCKQLRISFRNYFCRLMREMKREE